MTGASMTPMALILVVEDDRDIAETLELYLHAAGHRSDGRRSRAEA